MPSNQSPSRPVRPCGHRQLCISPSSTVVWVRGDHDAATRGQLAMTFARAADLDGADVVVDLSGVAFMDASTIGALVVARNHLLAHSRSLCVRNPSPRARRVLELCELTQLIDEDAAPGQPTAATALSSWVEVPLRDRTAGTAPPSVDEQAPALEPARVPAQHVEPARTIAQRRASS